MPDAPLGTVVRHIRRLAEPAAREPADRDLLADFTAGHDPSAFTALVRRHGPMVLNVCRHVLGHEQDAEDAFQATFLVLARKAASVRKGEALASFLHGVAYRTALKAKRAAARRRSHEARARAPAAPVDWGPAWREVQAVLDEEVCRLPESQRAPFVLCCLEGRTRAEAARQLGVKECTLASRLTAARKRLRQRLARRGIELSAVLGFAALATRAPAVPAPLLDAVARVAPLAARKLLTAGVVPARVLALAGGGARTVLAAKLALAALALLAAGLLAAGVGAASRPPTAAAPGTSGPAKSAENTPAKAPPAEGKVGKAPEGNVLVTGRVLGPDGKPFRGAELYLWVSPDGKKTGRVVKGATGEDGRFRFTMGRSLANPGGLLVASARGYGPDWVRLDEVKAGKELTLRLAKDDLPVRGRLIDLEGRPVAGATVEVVRVGKKPDGGDLKAWVDQNLAMRKEGFYLNENGLKVVGADGLGLPASVTTDKEGRLTLSGVGRERVLRLRARHPKTEQVVFWAMTRPAPARGLLTGNWGLYGASFLLLVGPCKPIVGTVRDKRTGKPLAGMVVASVYDRTVRTITDAKGRFCILGAPKRSDYWVSAGGGPGRPYFDATRPRVPDTPGMEPITVDVDLERGVEVTGRLTEKGTGKPVRGEVHYVPLPDNPHLKDYSDAFALLRVIVSDWGRTRADGSFSALGIPGPGLLMVCAHDSNSYTLLDPQTQLAGTAVRSFPTAPVHAIVRINPSEKDPKSLARHIALERGRKLPGTVLGPGHTPLAGAHVAGLASPAVFFRAPEEHPGSQGLKGADFTAVGVNPRGTRVLVFYHPEKKLGKVERLRGDAKVPVRVRLEELGSLRGRVVDARGRALAGLTVAVEVRGRPPGYGDFPWTDLYQGGLARRLQRKALTDSEGKFHVAGLIPGLPYELLVSKGEVTPDNPAILCYRNRLLVGSGKTNDLGDLKSHPVRGEKMNRP